MSYRITRRRSALRQSRRAVATLVLLFPMAACSEGTSPSKAKVVYGAAQALGQGTARTYVTYDASGTVAAIGVALSEAAMTGLPTMPQPGMPSAVNLTLALPTVAQTLGYNHVMLDWNPAGHEPEHVYTLPHFDFHFYQITPAQRDAIMPTDPQWDTKAGNFPSAAFVPAGYLPGSTLAGVPAGAAAVPMMGMHWLDPQSGELQLPPNNKTFTSTFIYGSYDGRFIFLEPMITKAYIESMKSKAEGVSFPIAVPQQVAVAGLYPSSYSIHYDAAAKEYRIAMENLTEKH